MSNPETTYSAFFYGTLLHPAVLTRVIRSEGAHLTICPAILKVHGYWLLALHRRACSYAAQGYTRHQVDWADFPGAYIGPC